MLIWMSWSACSSTDSAPYLAERAPLLSALLPTLFARRVTYLRDQPWCRALSYDRGHFGTSSHPSTCMLDPSPALPLDTTADSDLSAWMSALEAAAAVRPISIEIGYDPAGAPASAQLYLSYSQPWRLDGYSYLWAPGGPALTEDQRSTRAAGDWYLVREDWN